MSKKEIFNSLIRSWGDRAGVFEYDGETGYFYLCHTTEGRVQRISDAIHLFTGDPDFGEHDVNICWDRSERMVGVFIRGQLWAAFDTANGTKYGGNYRPGGQSNIPSEVYGSFELIRI